MKTQNLRTWSLRGLSLSSSIYFFLIALLLFACGKDDDVDPSTPPGGSSNQLVVSILTDDQGVVGRIIDLDGTSSKDGNGGTLSFVWSLKSQPVGANSNIAGAALPNASFVPTKPGQYVVSLTIKSGAFEKTAEKTINVADEIVINPGQPILIDRDILAETRLVNHIATLNEPDYIVRGEIRVYEYMFIENGVTLAFEEGAALIIENPGSITAIGMGYDILFTGLQQRPGYWKGIFINSNHSFNELDNVVIEYAGGGLIPGMDHAANLGIMKEGQGILKLKNSIIRHSAAYGIAIESGGRLSGSSFNNAYRQNEIPILIPASQLHNLDGLSYYPDNKANVINVIGTPVYNHERITWTPARSCYSCMDMKPEDMVPYRIIGEIDLMSELLIYQGTVLEFEQGGSFLVTDGSGALRSVGTVERPVVMRAAPGATWKGLAVKSKSYSGSELYHTIIEDAGHGLQDGWSYAASIVAFNEASVKLGLKNTTIRNSGGYGMFVGYNATLKFFDQNNFQGNELAPIALYARHVSSLDGKASAYQNNKQNMVEVWPSGLTSQGEAEVVWKALPVGVSYHITQGVAVQRPLRLQAGTHLKFGNHAYFSIAAEAHLIAEGTASNRIVFEGLNAEKGYWAGLHYESGSLLNLLNFVDIRHAGSSAIRAMPEPAAIVLDGTYKANITIKNSTISDIAGYGIYAYGDATVNADAETANTFVGVDKAAVKR